MMARMQQKPAFIREKIYLQAGVRLDNEVQNLSPQDTPYERLKALVINHSFRPGEQLQAHELAEYLGVSATPVREALVRLGAENLVTSVPNRGFFAKTLDLGAMFNHYEYAFLLMKHALEKDLRSFTLSGIDSPAALEHGHATEVARDLIRFNANFVEQLLERIVALAHNEFMIGAIRSFNDHTHYVRLLDLEKPKRAGEILRAAHDLVACLKCADKHGAIRILKRQFDRKLAALPALIKEGLSRAYAGLDRERLSRPPKV